ncbi:ABC transporter G family member 21 [Dorcoceras hygrometricum]|uniref:ABC transporter G family member 21 n=1 Tax=Dorcoceras hygrometricum TaxID=472368 RepID=A0A2Z7A8C6_9LAMI|nr:ABC transporter G family member 21 [Dorcoceras hygrometricum]
MYLITTANNESSKHNYKGHPMVNDSIHYIRNWELNDTSGDPLADAPPGPAAKPENHIYNRNSPKGKGQNPKGVKGMTGAQRSAQQQENTQLTENTQLLSSPNSLGELGQILPDLTNEKELSCLDWSRHEDIQTGPVVESEHLDQEQHEDQAQSIKKSRVQAQKDEVQNGSSADQVQHTSAVA